MKKLFDRFSAVLALLVILPAFFAGGQMYARFYSEATVIGVFAFSLFLAGITLPPMVFGIRSLFRLVIFIIAGRTSYDSKPKRHSLF